MPLFDRKCSTCGNIRLDSYEPTPQTVLCPCGAEMEKVWLGRAAAVIDDSIPGGYLVRHGICWPDGSPRRYDSKSEMARQAKRQGLTNAVEHIGSPGSDKNKNTSRWI